MTFHGLAGWNENGNLTVNSRSTNNALLSSKVEPVSWNTAN